MKSWVLSVFVLILAAVTGALVGGILTWPFGAVLGAIAFTAIAGYELAQANKAA